AYCHVADVTLTLIFSCIWSIQCALRRDRPQQEGAIDAGLEKRACVVQRLMWLRTTSRRQIGEECRSADHITLALKWNETTYWLRSITPEKTGRTALRVAVVPTAAR